MLIRNFIKNQVLSERYNILNNILYLLKNILTDILKPDTEFNRLLLDNFNKYNIDYDEFDNYINYKAEYECLISIIKLINLNSYISITEENLSLYIITKEIKDKYILQDYEYSIYYKNDSFIILQRDDF